MLYESYCTCRGKGLLEKKKFSTTSTPLQQSYRPQNSFVPSKWPCCCLYADCVCVYAHLYVLCGITLSPVLVQMNQTWHDGASS